MYAHSPMTESYMGSPGWVTKLRASSQWKGQCATKGQQSEPVGVCWGTVGVSGCKVLSLQEALEMIVEYANMS